MAKPLKHYEGRDYWIAGLSLASGALLGAIGMYLYDPNRGRARRAMLHDKAASAAKRAGQDLAGRAEDLVHRAKGAVARVGASVACSEESDDAVLIGRVRSHLGHLTHHAHAIETDVKDGVVTLKGILPEEERRRLVAEIGGISGVKDVRDCLACEIPAESLANV